MLVSIHTGFLLVGGAAPSPRIKRRIKFCGCAFLKRFSDGETWGYHFLLEVQQASSGGQKCVGSPFRWGLPVLNRDDSIYLGSPLYVCASKSTSQLLLINRQGLTASFNFCHTRYGGVFFFFFGMLLAWIWKEKSAIMSYIVYSVFLPHWPSPV